MEPKNFFAKRGVTFVVDQLPYANRLSVIALEISHATTFALIITQFGRIFKYFFFCLLHVLFVIRFFIKSKKTIDYFKEICYNCNNKNILILWRT